MEIRFATSADAAPLLAIYAQYINTPATFECSLPSVQEFGGRISAISASYPYLTIISGGEIAGYAYAHRHMERAAYQWNVELSIYLSAPHVARGLGGRLYGVLFEILKLQNVKAAYAGITIPNPASERLHAAMGFEKAGVFRNAGYKNGRWHDVVWFQKDISEHLANPAPFIPLGDLPAGALHEIIASYGSRRDV